MRNQCRRCVQCTLKMLNSILTMVGVAMILYSLWMLKKWHSRQHTMLLIREIGVHLPRPWFIYAFLSMGIIVCFITFSGHVAAETANGLFLSIYILFVCLLLLLQAGVAVYVTLKKNWDSDIPEDPTGQFDQLRQFLKTNFDICRTLKQAMIADVSFNRRYNIEGEGDPKIQALTILLALLLRALGPNLGGDRESENDFIPFRSNIKQSFLIHPDSQPIFRSEPQLV